jgi:hypothetical protein
VRIAVPDAPRDRGISLRKLLEHRYAIHWRHVEPTVCGREKDPKEAGVRRFAREIFR